MSSAGANPFAEFTEYELKYLVTHLASAENTRHVHELLARDSDAPSHSGGEEGIGTAKLLRLHANAWFTAREERGDTEGYLDDVARAWRLAEQESYSSIEVGRPAARLALEVRYALVTASLGSLARGTPPTLLRALVDAGTWTLPQALQYARQIPLAPLRAEALAWIHRGTV
jgi:hypothetical protein